MTLGTIAWPPEKTENREASVGGKNADFAGAALARQGPETAPTLGERAKKIPTDEWLGFWVLVEAGGLNISYL